MMPFSRSEKSNAAVIAKIAFLLLLLLLLASTSVFALGIKPAQQRLHYTADTEYEGRFTVIRDTPEKSIAHLMADGPLAEYISFATEYVTLEGAETVIKYTLSLPAGLAPGEVTSRILVEQALNPDAEGIGAKILLPFTIRVNVPYPEKFVKASLEIVPSGTSLNIAATVENVGAQPVEQVTPRVTITDAEQQHITTIPLDSEPLGLFEKKTFEKNIEIGKLKSGSYRATAAVTYDDNTIAVVKDFTVGVPIVGVLFKEKFFKAGDVSPFTIQLENQWNAPLKNVVATLIVKSKGLQVAGVRTDPFDIDVRDTVKKTAYLDARKLVPGTYDAVLAITYDGGSTEDPYTIEILPVDEYAEAIKNSGVSSSSGSWTFFGLSLLLLVNGAIAVFVVMKMLRKKPEMNSAEQAIAEFVHKARKVGFDDETIRAQLAKTGWPAALIAKVLGKS